MSCCGNHCCMNVHNRRPSIYENAEFDILVCHETRHEQIWMPEINPLGRWIAERVEAPWSLEKPNKNRNTKNRDLWSDEYIAKCRAFQKKMEDRKTKCNEFIGNIDKMVDISEIKKIISKEFTVENLYVKPRDLLARVRIQYFDSDGVVQEIDKSIEKLRSQIEKLEEMKCVLQDIEYIPNKEIKELKQRVKKYTDIEDNLSRNMPVNEKLIMLSFLKKYNHALV